MIRFTLLLLPLAFACSPDDTLLAPTLVTNCAEASPASMRVATYNVKSAEYTTLDQIADTLASISPDVVALQEVNVNEERNQVQQLADRLGYQAIYAAALRRPAGTYGVALLTRFPVHRVDRINLRATGAVQPRVAIDADLCVGPTSVRVLATHVDVWQPVPNIEELASHLDTQVTTPTVLMGDLNVDATEPYPGRFTDHGLIDVIAQHCEGPTFRSNGKRLDYLFVDPWLDSRVTAAEIGTSKASDHYPIWVDFKLD